MGIRSIHNQDPDKAYFDRHSRSTKRRAGTSDDTSTGKPTRSSFEFAVTGDVTSFDEGHEYTIGILCPTGTYSNGTTLYYTIFTVSGGTFDNSDLRLNNYQGSFTVNDDQGFVSLDVTDDGTSEDSVIRLEIRENSTSGSIVATSSNYTIVDTLSEILYDIAGTYSFVAPVDAASSGVDAVCIGGGGGGDTSGGGGGGLGWKNGIPVSPGSSYTVQVGGGGQGGGSNGGDSYFVSPGEVRGSGGSSASGTSSGSGGGYTGHGGGNGGSGSSGPAWGGGGGGAGGYGGSGGNAGTQQGSPGGGGAAGGGASNSPADPPGNNIRKGGAGGGTSLMGQGPDGTGAAYHPIGGYGGGGGSYADFTPDGYPPAKTGGLDGNPGGVHVGGVGGRYGGGGGGANSTGWGGSGGTGGVRLLWGPNRSFPNTNTGVQ